MPTASDLIVETINVVVSITYTSSGRMVQKIVAQMHERQSDVGFNIERIAIEIHLKKGV